MLTLSVNGEALRRQQSVPEGEGADDQRRFVEHYEPKQASRFLGMLRQRVAHDYGHLGQLVGRIEQFKLMIRKFRGQSGGEVSDKMHQATFQPDTMTRAWGIISLSTRDDGTPSTRWSLRTKPSRARGLEERFLFPWTSQSSKAKAS